MRGNTKDVTNNALTLVFSIAVIFALYTFGTAIFQRGAAVKVFTIEEGGCACVDAVANVEISCGGAKALCRACEKDILQLCKTNQKITGLKEIIRSPVKKIKACTLPFGNVNILVDGVLKGTTGGDDKCVIIKFPEPKEIDSIEGIIDEPLDRLVVSWEK